MKLKNLFNKLRDFNFKNKRSKTLFFLSLILILASAVATYTYLSGSKQGKFEPKNDELKVLAAQDETFEFDETLANDGNTLNILLLGYGGAGHSGGFLTDVIQVVHLDFENSKIAFISIPRDLWVQLPNGTSNKINQAFSLGNKNDLINSGAKVSAQMVTAVTGLKIDKFISVDFVGFKRAIGYELKNIKVDVPETLDDPWYPISGKEQDVCGKTPDEVASLSSQLSGFQLEQQFECRYEHIYFDKGINTMEGGDALAYVRSRHGSAGGDFDRSQRQQALLLGVRDRLFELETLKNIPGFFKQMIAHTDTNLSVDLIKQLAPKLLEAKDYKIINVTLSTANVFTSSKSSSGQYIIIPKSGENNWAGSRTFVQAELEK
ncbi:LCP family protein [Patescibacteria group bacterium]|nr:LCP family protein [Patescibacteria group bacterium]